MLNRTDNFQRDTQQHSSLSISIDVHECSILFVTTIRVQWIKSVLSASIEIAAADKMFSLCKIRWETKKYNNFFKSIMSSYN